MKLHYALVLASILALGACGSETGGETASAERSADAGDEQESAVEAAPPGVTTQSEVTAPTPTYATDRESEQTEIDAPESAETLVSDSGDPCRLAVVVGDDIAYSVTEMQVPSSCEEVTVDLTHTGRMPVNVMGHNWVLVPADAMQSVVQAGATAGLEAGYLPKDDDRVIAATRLIGAGESDSVTFRLDTLEEGTDYMYVCTFPGHWVVMQGTFEVTG